MSIFIPQAKKSLRRAPISNIQLYHLEKYHFQDPRHRYVINITLILKYHQQSAYFMYHKLHVGHMILHALEIYQKEPYQ